MKKMLIAQVKRIKDIHSIAIKRYLNFNLKKNHSVKARQSKSYKVSSNNFFGKFNLEPDYEKVMHKKPHSNSQMYFLISAELN